MIYWDTQSNEFFEKKVDLPHFREEEGKPILPKDQELKEDEDSPDDDAEEENTDDDSDEDP